MSPESVGKLGDTRKTLLFKNVSEENHVKNTWSRHET